MKLKCTTWLTSLVRKSRWRNRLGITDKPFLVDTSFILYGNERIFSPFAAVKPLILKRRNYFEFDSKRISFIQSRQGTMVCRGPVAQSVEHPLKVSVWFKSRCGTRWLAKQILGAQSVAEIRELFGNKWLKKEYLCNGQSGLLQEVQENLGSIPVTFICFNLSNTCWCQHKWNQKWKIALSSVSLQKNYF